MPTRHQQLLLVEQRSDGAVIYNGRQFRTGTFSSGNIFTAAGLIEVGPNFGTGPAIVQVLTGFRPKAIFFVTGMDKLTSSATVSARCNSMGITVDDGGTLVRYCRSIVSVSASSYSAGDENGRVFSGPLSYRIYRTTTPNSKTLTTIDGNVTAMNDSGFSIEVDNNYSYKIAFLAFGGDITIAHGKFPIDTDTSTSASLPFSPDFLILLDMPRWNNELIYYQLNAGSSKTYSITVESQRTYYTKYQRSSQWLFHRGIAPSGDSVNGKYYFYAVNGGPWVIDCRFTMSGNTLTVDNWRSSSARYTSEAGYLAISGLPSKIRAFSPAVDPMKTVNYDIRLDFEPGSMILETTGHAIVFDPHEQSPGWVCFNLVTVQAGNISIGLVDYLFMRKRIPGYDQYFYVSVTNHHTSSRLVGTAYIIQLATNQPITRRELTLFVSSWYRQYLGIRKRWAKLLSAVNNFLVSLFYQSNRRTEMEMELSVSSEHESSLFHALAKLLHVRGFSISEIIDTTWGRNLRPIRLLTPADIDVCRGDQLVLRLKTRHANQDRNMRDMNDIVRMALLDYRTGNPVYWLGLGSGIEYDDEGQAVIVVPWEALNQALGRERICRYRVELWPDERTGAAGWIVHVGIIREVR
jgi:hypothetical protein